MSYEHVLNFLTETAWAMTPQMLEKIYGIVETRVSGVEIDIAGIEASLGRKLENSREITIKNKTAIIPIMGIISKRMGMFTQISGGASTEAIQGDIQSSLENKDIESIALMIDSPGGSVPGQFELSDFIFNARGKKPIVAYADGMMLSAAYLIGSAADEIIAYDSSQVGSIGVVSIHTDISESDKQAGIKRTILTAGKYKALGNSYEPLSKPAQDYTQEGIDYIYSLFINSVMRNRGITEEKALSMADGKVFIGQQALDVGLVDKMGNFNFALKRAQKRKVKKMDLATLKAEHQDLVVALQDEGREQGQKIGYAEGIKAGQKTGYDEGLNAGIEMEKSRESEIRGCMPVGMEELASKLIREGTSVSDSMKAMLQAAKADASARLDADTKIRTAKIDQLHLESPSPIIPIKVDKQIDDNNNKSASQQLSDLTEKKLGQNQNLDYISAFKAVQLERPDLAKKYQKELLGKKE